MYKAFKKIASRSRSSSRGESNEDEEDWAEVTHRARPRPVVPQPGTQRQGLLPPPPSNQDSEEEVQVDVHQEDDNSSSSSSSSEEAYMDPEQKKYLVQLTGALSPKRPPGDRCLVQEVSERRRKKRLSELGCPKSLRKSVVAVKEDFLPAGYFLLRNGTIYVHKDAAVQDLGSFGNMVPHLELVPTEERRKARFISFDPISENWYHFSTAEKLAEQHEKLRRKEKKNLIKEIRRELGDQTEEIARLTELLAEAEKRAQSGPKAAEMKETSSAVFEWDSYEEKKIDLATIMKDKSFLQLPEFSNGVAYMDFLNNFKYWWTMHKFPTKEAYVGAVKRTMKHPSHNYLVNALMQDEIHDWSSLVQVMKNKFAPQLSLEANLERISTMKISDEEERTGDFNGFSFRIQKELDVALDELEGMTPYIKKILKAFMGKDYFIRGLPEDIRHFVKLQFSVKTLADAISAASKYKTNKNDTPILEGTVAAAMAGDFGPRQPGLGEPYANRGRGRGRGQRGRGRGGARGERGGRGAGRGRGAAQPPQPAQKRDQSRGRGEQKQRKEGSEQQDYSREAHDDYDRQRYFARADICVRCKDMCSQNSWLTIPCPHCFHCKSDEHSVEDCPVKGEELAGKKY